MSDTQVTASAAKIKRWREISDRAYFVMLWISAIILTPFALYSAFLLIQLLVE